MTQIIEELIYQWLEISKTKELFLKLTKKLLYWFEVYCNIFLKNVNLIK